MPVATKPKRRPASAGGGNGRGDLAALAKVAKAARPNKIEARQIATKSIVPSPYQPRAAFPEEEIRGLAESIARQGLLSPLLARKKQAKSECYELVDGERRWRAAKLIGLATIRTEIGEFTDAQARQIVLASAIQRKDLNAIEEARAYRAALDAGDAAGPTELAQQLGLSQGQVSNRLRLLELPKEVQSRVISREIPATHARELVRFKTQPALISAIVKDLIKQGSEGEPLPTVGDFRCALWFDVERHAQVLGGEEWDQATGRHVPRFTPTPEQREKLGIVSCDDPTGKKAIEFAVNQTAWKKMQTVHRKRWLKDHPVGKSTNGKQGRKAAATAAKKNPKKLTPAQAAAEKKRQEAADRERRAVQARQTAKRVHRWAVDRLRRGAAERLPKACTAEQDRVILYLMIASESFESYDYREQVFQLALRCDGGAFKSKVLWRTVEKISPGVVRDRLVATAAEILYSSQHGPRCRLPDHVAVMIAEHLAVRLDALWKTDQKQQAGKTYFDLHTREQLVDLGAELSVYLDDKMPKSKMIRLLTSQQKALPLPKELKKIKPK